MPQNPPAGVPRISPRLAYLDVDAAVEWLVRAFGFRERESGRVDDPSGSRTLTELRLLDGHLLIGRAGNHDLESPRQLGGRSGMSMVYVDDVDAHYERARAAGAEIVIEIGDQPWGDRRYEALDPEGHRWYFAQHVRDVAPDDRERKSS